VTTREKIKHPEGTDWYEEAITAIKQARSDHTEDNLEMVAVPVQEGMVFDASAPLVMTPHPAFAKQPTAQRHWVDLSDEEINSVRYKRDWTAPWTDTTFARAIEAKLKEKNNG